MAKAEQRSAWTGTRAGAPAPRRTPNDGGDPSLLPEAVVGSAEHLQWNFTRAATVADRAVGLWLARSAPVNAACGTPGPAADSRAGELLGFRALVRASTTAYVRRLRADGHPPERMLVLVKSAIGSCGPRGLGVRELTNDVVRWSIEAYFND